MKLSLFGLIVLLTLISCKENKQHTEASRIVREWVGKQIKFPADYLCNVKGIDAVPFLCSDLMNKEYKILLYVDSVGCTSCKLRLYAWYQMMEEADTLLKDQVSFLFFFHPKNKKELNYLLKRDGMNYPVLIDLENKIDQLNHFPDQPAYQCFLLNRENKVLMIGNPIANPKIWELYKEEISGVKNINSSPLTTVKADSQHYDYGELSVNEESESVFVVENTGDQPFIISRVNASCGCTSVEWEKQPVEKRKTTTIKITMKPDEVGYFNKTIEVFGNIEGTPLKLTVSGTATNKSN